MKIQSYKEDGKRYARKDHDLREGEHTTFGVCASFTPAPDGGSFDERGPLRDVSLS